MSSPTRLCDVRLGDGPAAWAAAGFTIDEAGTFVVGGVRFICTGQGSGIQSWGLSGPDPMEVDGLAAHAGSDDLVASGGHANGAMLLDHLVVGSPNRERTIEAFRSGLGLLPSGQTEHVLYGRAMVQTFFLLTPTLIEVVSRPGAAGDGPSTFWGLAFTVEDLDGSAQALGAACSAPKQAVQPGRRIATLDNDVLGITVPTALLSPRPRRQS